jgi:hypothetical protein
VEAKAPSVAVNTQLDAALLNSQALGKLMNKANKLYQLNKEIEKKRLRRASAPRRAFLHPCIFHSHHSTKNIAFSHSRFYSRCSENNQRGAKDSTKAKLQALQ